MEKGKALKGFLQATLLAVFACCIAVPARADLTLGTNPASYTSGGVFDTCPGCLFALAEVPGPANGDTLSSFSFYGLTTNTVTPIIYSGTLSDLTIVWVGTPETPASANMIDTYTISDAPALVAGEYLGYRDGGTGSLGAFPDGQGDVAFTGEGTGSGIYYYDSTNTSTGYTGSISAGMDNLAFTNAFTDTRNYYADFTLTATPEPMYYGVLGIGLALLFLSHRSKKLG